MKIDMTRDAISRRLKTANELRRACLSLANSSVGKKIQQKHADNKSVQRTIQALGH